jgi:hypothetical protein
MNKNDVQNVLKTKGYEDVAGVPYSGGSAYSVYSETGNDPYKTGSYTTYQTFADYEKQEKSTKPEKPKADLSELEGFYHRK